MISQIIYDRIKEESIQIVGVSYSSEKTVNGKIQEEEVRLQWAEGVSSADKKKSKKIADEILKNKTALLPEFNSRKESEKNMRDPQRLADVLLRKGLLSLSDFTEDRP